MIRSLFRVRDAADALANRVPTTLHVSEHSLAALHPCCYTAMEWDVEVTDEFIGWLKSLPETQQKVVGEAIEQLEAAGPTLEYPMSSKIRGSRHSHLRELRIQHRGRPLRVLYAFGPRRTAILLLGGDKRGDDRWYERNIPIADGLYDTYLRELKEEGLI